MARYGHVPKLRLGGKHRSYRAKHRPGKGKKSVWSLISTPVLPKSHRRS